MRRKGVSALLVITTGLLTLWVLVFPGAAVVQCITVNSQTCVTHEKLQRALDQSGWDYRYDKAYYLVGYSIRVRSYLPVALQELKPDRLKEARGVRVQALPPLFADSVSPLGQRVVYCEFLFEVGRDTPIVNAITEFDFALKAGSFPSSIRVAVPVDAQMNLNENPVPG